MRTEEPNATATIARHDDLLAGLRRAIRSEASAVAEQDARAIAPLLQGYGAAVARQRENDAADPPINLLAAAGRERDERLYCSLLAWLLEPNASHCQGAAFLSALAEWLGLPSEKLEHARVTTEVASEESRIDVEAAVPGSFLLHLEAKVDSEEGDDQTPREARDLAARKDQLGVPDSGARAAFLTRTGEHAASDTFRSLSWLDVASALRPVLNRDVVHERVRALAGHVLDCFEALTTGGRMGRFALGDVDKYLLERHADIIELQRSWESLERRVLGLLTESAWQAIADKKLAGQWEVYLKKGSCEPHFRRTDWFVGADDEWTCVETGNFTLRGFLSSDPKEQAWVGIWWGRLRDHFNDDELAKSAKKWASAMPGAVQGVRFEKNYALWWPFRLDVGPDVQGFDQMPERVVREVARLSGAFDDLAEMSRLAKKRA